MQITVKLFATLAGHLPAGARHNAAELDVDDDATPATIIERLNLPREKCHLVLVNGVYVVPSQLESHRLKPGDALAMWPPVAGG
ncbi:MoaD/ThiS family protein [Azospirillum sp. TSO22-1]|uniref:MoaD/ThiS family protein n=1 Tax=Azospirillum sp. TSO22-1 TaxID=716789 RepID=UPI000D60B9A9|nr:MoaD/ThiS family protein [Azospirillum sp. TSO22-1]PWC56630.1 thiamine biosynthesis protein ThiS [Azospirillum sp. TSO22-1]